MHSYSMSQYAKIEQIKCQCLKCMSQITYGHCEIRNVEININPLIS